MKFEDKMNRAFKRALVTYKDWNAGAIRKASCEWRISNEGKTQRFSIEVSRSHPSLSLYGYGDKSKEGRFHVYKNSGFSFIEEIPDYLDKIKLQEMIDLANSQTDEELKEIHKGYQAALKEFKESFCI